MTSSADNLTTLSGSVSTRDLRSTPADVLGRATYAGERIGITRNGTLAAVVIGVEDLETLETLEAFELSRDAQAYRDAKAQDDGARISSADLRAELGL